MNDTFSEDAWKKLNTMKQQRQQKQMQSQAKIANAQPVSHGSNKAATLNITNQR